MVELHPELARSMVNDLPSESPELIPMVVESVATLCWASHSAQFREIIGRSADRTIALGRRSWPMVQSSADCHIAGYVKRRRSAIGGKSC